MSRISSLAVVFPMFNEADYVSKVISRTVDVLKTLTNDYEIIIVDDASTDGCGQIADGLSQKNERIRVVHHLKNRKLGGSLKTGFNLASKDLVLYSDMDLPFDLNEISKAVRLLHSQAADLVCAYRLERAPEGVRRLAYSAIYNLFIKIMFGLNVRDVNFSFKLIKKNLLHQLHLTSEGSFISAELLIKASRRGAKIVQFGTRYFPRVCGRSTLSSFGVILKILQEAFAFRFGKL